MQFRIKSHQFFMEFFSYRWSSLSFWKWQQGERPKKRAESVRINKIKVFNGVVVKVCCPFIWCAVFFLSFKRIKIEYSSAKLWWSKAKGGKSKMQRKTRHIVNSTHMFIFLRKFYIFWGQNKLFEFCTISYNICVPWSAVSVRDSKEERTYFNQKHSNLFERALLLHLSLSVVCCVCFSLRFSIIQLLKIYDYNKTNNQIVWMTKWNASDMHTTWAPTTSTLYIQPRCFQQL